MDEVESLILNLGSPRLGSGDVWFNYVMSMMEQIAPMRTYSDDHDFRVADAVRDCREAVESADRVFVIGPPFLVADFCAAVEQDGGIAGDDSLFVFTGGGWKNRASEETARAEFTGRVVGTLGLDSVFQVRDVFNQVELNTLLVECGEHRKHVPPWVHVFTRDPESLEPLPDGQVGILSYSDATANSYPCFFIGDDLGRVNRGQCACGRQAVTFEVVRRLRGTSHEGCAETMLSSLESFQGADAAA